tara:strand:+ start:1685 stop:2359 length:675 start_codon:yes stop_codon:yes gene_type:complete
MAERPVFIPQDGMGALVEEIGIEFKWHAGLAPSQKVKNIEALHKAAEQQGLFPILEVSTKSKDELGMRLSAFNLQVATDEDGKIPLECAFQGSKVFEGGGPYRELFHVDGRKAKKDARISKSGALTGFNFEGQEFPLSPETAFYDWLYIKALLPIREKLDLLHKYEGFTDIEFNPKKSKNCQARSCATYVTLEKRGVLEETMSSPEKFIMALKCVPNDQGELFE